MEEEYLKARAIFLQKFGSCENVTVCSAPGRVNLIGEHTDYNEGYVMPFCLKQKTVVIGRRTNKGVIRIASGNSPDGKLVIFKGDSGLKPKDSHWSNYVRGVVKQYLSLCDNQIGFDAAFYSSVPLGGGLSSSASLEVVTATFIESAYGLDVDKQQRALRCQKAEHEFAGVPCGIMDQFISSCGKEGNVLLIDCRPPFATTDVPLDDPNVSLVVANTNKKHKLSGSEYPERVNHCKEAAAALGEKFLRDVTLEHLTGKKDSLDPVVFKRAYHGVTEDVRTLAAVKALQAKDYVQVGKLMNESHESLRDNYEVSCKELDCLQASAIQIEGCYGARMTGGGFGGCTVSLVETKHVANFIKELRERYIAETNIEPTIFATKAAKGACVVSENMSLSDSAVDFTSITTMGAGAAVAIGIGYIIYKSLFRKQTQV